MSRLHEEEKVVPNRSDLLARILQKRLLTANSPEEKASCYRSFGVLAENFDEYDLAIGFYAKGRALFPKNTEEAYWLHNNAGYCLNVKGEHVEAEVLCRRAIEIAPSRYNAWKNLGVSLEGQGDFVDAAWAYLEAMVRTSKDDRAQNLLTKLSQRVLLPPEVTALFRASQHFKN